MLKLTPVPSEPYWLPEVSGVRLKVRPYRPAGLIIARRAATQALSDEGDRGLATEAFVIALAQWAVIAWEGIGDAEGEVVGPTAERIEQLFRASYGREVYDGFDRDYATPILLGEREKNVSSPAPNGGSARAAKATAPLARAGVKNARSKSTPPKVKGASSPGK